MKQVIRTSDTCDTSYTRNTAISSDASKTSASVTRLSSYLLGYVSKFETSPFQRGPSQHPSTIWSERGALGGRGIRLWSDKGFPRLKPRPERCCPILKNSNSHTIHNKVKPSAQSILPPHYTIHTIVKHSVRSVVAT